MDLVWESATPPTHIWEKSKKTRFFGRLHFREDIFWGKGKDLSEATEEERLADMGER